MKKIIKQILSLLLMLLVYPALVQANIATDQLKDVGAVKGPYSGADQFALSDVIGVVIQAALSLIGVVFLILMLYAGYNWMTARGEEDKVTKAKETLMRAIIGIIIVIGSYAIWAFIFSKIF